MSHCCCSPEFDKVQHEEISTFSVRYFFFVHSESRAWMENLGENWRVPKKEKLLEFPLTQIDFCTPQTSSFYLFFLHELGFIILFFLLFFSLIMFIIFIRIKVFFTIVERKWNDKYENFTSTPSLIMDLNILTLIPFMAIWQCWTKMLDIQFSSQNRIVESSSHSQTKIIKKSFFSISHPSRWFRANDKIREIPSYEEAFSSVSTNDTICTLLIQISRV